MRILIVDDSRIMRNIVKNTLKRLQFSPDSFLEAADGQLAWTILEQQEVSLLLLDWNMPNLNGLDLLKRLRSHPKYNALPIIMVTSEAAKYNVIEAVKAGVNDYLVKPVTEKSLEEKIRRVLEREAILNVKYITPFIDAVQGAFDELFGLQPQALTPYLVRKEEVLDWDISGIIGIAGEAKGLVVLSFPAPLAQELTGLLTGNSKTSLDDDVTDAVGELVNIIAGNAKKGLEEFRLLISLPSIVQGKRHQVTWPSGPVPIVTIPFSTDRGQFSLSVGLENIITA